MPPWRPPPSAPSPAPVVPVGKRCYFPAIAGVHVMRSIVLSVALLAPTLTSPSQVRADADDLRIMAEPIGYTAVLDAFDEDDPFDVDVHVGYRRATVEATIQRESATSGGRSSVDFVDLGTSLRVVKQMTFGVDVGLYRDLMLTLRLPFILSDERTIDWLRVSRSANDSFTPLFGTATQFKAKPRFGVPGLDIGLRWGVTNQYRSPGWPTWVLLAETHYVTGEVLRACADGDDCEAGISPGASELELGSRWSYRSRYLEPYLGIAYVWPIVTSGEALHGPNGGRASSGSPPEEGELTVGMAVVPWEDRRRFQRFVVDLRSFVSHRTAGREASPMFDALGTSELLGNRSTGLSDVEARVRGGIDLGLVMRAARYVRFRVSVALSQSTPYLITTAPGCDGTIVLDPMDSSMGSCGGAPFVPVIELPGGRFRVDGELTTDLRATASGQF